jgi:hypothetical protein
MLILPARTESSQARSQLKLGQTHEITAHKESVMLKKAGTVAAITAGLMLLGSAAFAEASAPNAVGRMGLLAPPRDFVIGSGVSDLNTLFGFAAFSSATGDNPSGYATFRNGGAIGVARWRSPAS